jgi:hypothetical protein
MVGGSTGSFGFAGGFAGGGSLRSVAGHPYSALEETQTVQTLADGTHITQGSQKVMYYRDSRGRTRTERTMLPPAGFLATETPPAFIEIVDPVAGFRYSFDQRGRTAHRTPFGPVRVPKGTVSGGVATRMAVLSSGSPLPPPPPLAPALRTSAASPTQSASQPPRPEIIHESLGTQNFESVLAEGTKTTTTWPVGFFGNDRPITTVNETWTWRELGMAVLTRTADPRSGETTTRLSNISQAEPDAALFQIPADYEIVDPTGQTAK